MFTSLLLLLGDFSSCVLFPVSELLVYVVTLRDRSVVRLRDFGTIPLRFSPSVLWDISICYGLLSNASPSCPSNQKWMFSHQSFLQIHTDVISLFVVAIRAFGIVKRRHNHFMHFNVSR